MAQFLAVAALFAVQQGECCGGLFWWVYCADPPAATALKPTAAPEPNVYKHTSKQDSKVNTTSNNAANSTNHNNVNVSAGGDQTQVLLHEKYVAPYTGRRYRRRILGK
ncbi:hypothetical protein PRIPAC_83511 [Pristionchus pacificus]|uniref:Uncharacterized protein n=1 Tax=Pristionchus pacificus TaxID=54126 RepID=A0A2A6BM03_PRIPA|nr:hypothetical protein PRIPAC_83511 [Pristionchus pacificus]|eukprot:PDM66833.1 hypothetical protein PRIPAC_48250 [Pristionchus pacificus]